ncbi:MAG TPA: ABC transporter permease [Candidatus Acidoferrales bacterium]|nr:ABC transporter permease [Candidatus Acidoferrales bacterium]
MTLLARLRSWLRAILHRSRTERDMDAELRSHIDSYAEDLLRSGLPRAEALRRARLEFGGLERVKEECRESRGISFVESLAQDLRFGLRMLRKSPGFTAVAVLTLALGIGANTAMFSIVDGVLLKPLAYSQPDQLVSLRVKASNGDEIGVSYPNFLDWQISNKTFSSIAAYFPDDFTLSLGDKPERLHGERVSSSFFSLLSVQPLLGRVYTANEDQLGAAPVALISARLWARKFGSSKGILGKAITLSGTQYTVIGVLPASFCKSFFTDDRYDVYIPIGISNDSLLRDRKNHTVEVVARLKAGATLAQADADIATIDQALAREYPDSSGSGIALIPLKRDIVGDVQPLLLMLLGGVGFVLLIACTNVANLLMVRAAGRKAEFALRAALGARQGRMVRQVLTESVLVALCGGALGLLFAVWGTQAALSALPAALPRAVEIGLDTRVLFFTAAVSLLAGILFGLSPALRASRVDVNHALKECSRGFGGGHRKIQSILVVGEMASAMMLIIGAGLMIRSLNRLWRVDPGFDPNHALTFKILLPASVSASAARTRVYLEQLRENLDALPGVEASSATMDLPLSGQFPALPFWLEGQPKPSSMMSMDIALFYAVEPEYFSAMGIPLQRGRLLSLHDDERSPFVIVIDDVFAHQFFGDQDPIGKRVNLTFGFPQAQIVGIVRHVKHSGLDSDAAQPIRAQFYCRLVQLHDTDIQGISGNLSVVMRTKGAPMAMVGPVQRTLEKMSGDQVMYDERSMSEVVSDSLAAKRFSMILLSVFAALALALASMGIYGVVSYVAAQRTHEIGIRLALGARPGDILRLVMRQGATLALVGVAIGLVAALGLTRLIKSMLFGVSPTDSLTFAGVAILLTLVALLACYIPARRAMRVDPMVALRYE